MNRCLFTDTAFAERHTLRNIVICGSLVSCVSWMLLHHGRPFATATAGTTMTDSDERDAKLLQRFIDECVDIRPGTEHYPRTFQFGPVSESELTTLQVREVKMPSSFRISRYETTQELYEMVIGSNPSRWQGPRNSVEYVSYDDATQFCSRLTTLLRREKLISQMDSVRLPSEQEWEYCCRAGSTSLFSFPTNDDDHSSIDEFAWHHGNAAGNDPAVGVLKPNAWGLFDMHGYLWEFVTDPWQPAVNTATALAQIRTIRGGSWRDDAASLTCAARLPLPSHAVSDAIGFRCVIDKVR
jgi:formylglycine-generating enzyme required for sulfatase activity